MSWLWFLIIVFVVPEIFRRIFTPKRAARRIVETSKAVYSGPHEFAEVRAADFRDLDLQFYKRAQAELEAFGFRHVADIEDLTGARQFPRIRTFIRALTGDNSSTSAGIYQLKFRGFYRLLQLAGVLAKKPFFIDLESEFSDGTFLATSNTSGQDLSSAVPGIQRQTLPQGTPIAQLVTAHREQFARQCQQGRTATKFGSLAELLAMQHRLQEAKNRHKKNLGYVDAEQTARIAAKHLNAEDNHALALELRALREQNLAASPSGTDTPAVSGR